MFVVKSKQNYIDYSYTVRKYVRYLFANEDNVVSSMNHVFPLVFFLHICLQGCQRSSEEPRAAFREGVGHSRSVDFYSLLAQLKHQSTPHVVPSPPAGRLCLLKAVLWL